MPRCAVLRVAGPLSVPQDAQESLHVAGPSCPSRQSCSVPPFSDWMAWPGQRGSGCVSGMGSSQAGRAAWPVSMAGQPMQEQKGARYCDMHLSRFAVTSRLAAHGKHSTYVATYPGKLRLHGNSQCSQGTQRSRLAGRDGQPDAGETERQLEGKRRPAGYKDNQSIQDRLSKSLIRSSRRVSVSRGLCSEAS